jgi:hypothetical protein
MTLASSRQATGGGEGNPCAVVAEVIGNDGSGWPKHRIVGNKWQTSTPQRISACLAPTPMNFLDFMFVSTVFVSVAVGSSLAVIKWGQWEIGPT